MFQPQANGAAFPNGFVSQEGNDLELASEYESELAELTFNSKPIINNLTIIAGENVFAANQIVTIIENRIRRVESDKKLPALYLLDSICKNIGGAYADLFGQKIVSLFSDTYLAVDAETKASMGRLLDTWDNLFPVASLQQIRAFLNSLQKRVNPPIKSSQQRPQNRAGTVIVNPNFVAKKISQQNSPKAGSTPATRQPLNGPANTRQQANRSGGPIPNKQQPPSKSKPTPPKSTSRVDEIMQGQGRTRANFQTPVTPPVRQPQSQGQIKQDPQVNPLQQPIYSAQDVTVLQFQIQQLMSVILSALQTQLTATRSPQEQITLLTQLQAVQQLQQQIQFTTSGAILQGHLEALRTLYPFATVGPVNPLGMLHNVPSQPEVPSQPPGLGYPPAILPGTQPFMPPSSVLPGIPGYALPPVQPTTWAPQPPVQTPAVNPTDLLSNLAAYGLLKPAAPAVPSAPVPSTPTPAATPLPLPRPASAGAPNKPPLKRQRSLRDPWSSEALKRRDDAIINELYFDFTMQCKNCGLRFADRGKLDQHLDWHFVQNRKEKEKTRKAMSRGWHPTKEEWIISSEIQDKTAVPFPFGDGAEEEQKQELKSVPADENQTNCPKCGESFEQYYDSDLDEWMYKDTVSVQGVIYHVKCSLSNNETHSEIQKVDETALDNKVSLSTEVSVDQPEPLPTEMPPLEDHDTPTKRPPPEDENPEESVKRARQEEPLPL
jgi:pre-mRNA cleavage complex 2 protein Pcf11